MADFKQLPAVFKVLFNNVHVQLRTDHAAVNFAVTIAVTIAVTFADLIPDQDGPCYTWFPKDHIS